jgi:protein SCO1/2
VTWGLAAAPAAGVAAALLALGGCGGQTGGAVSTAGGPAVVGTVPAGDTGTGTFAGGTVSPLKAAPEIGLATWDGRPVRMADYRGDAVLVTFVYTRCPDICPLIVDNLVRVKERLGDDGKRLRIVAVSVDPERDTPEAVKGFLARHRAAGIVDYVVGARPELEKVWARWGIGARVSPDDPALVEHSGTIWGVDPEGRRATFYPAVGFDADDIATDVRVLLSR